MVNPYESGERKVIPAVLIYARHEGRLLLIHRCSGNRVGGEVDYHQGRWNGLGGKLELDESVRQAARREFHEESGICLPEERFEVLGHIDFPNFKAHKGEDWSVTVFTLSLSAEEAGFARSTSDEGSLHWVPEADLGQLNFWPGDRHFVPLVVASRPFFGTIWYTGTEVSRFWVQELRR